MAQAAARDRGCVGGGGRRGADAAGGAVTRYRYAGRLRIWVFSGNPTPFRAKARSTRLPDAQR